MGKFNGNWRFLRRQLVDGHLFLRRCSEQRYSFKDAIESRKMLKVRRSFHVTVAHFYSVADLRNSVSRLGNSFSAATLVIEYSSAKALGEIAQGMEHSPSREGNL